MERLRSTIAETLPDNSLGEEHFSLLRLKNNESWKGNGKCVSVGWRQKEGHGDDMQRVKKPHFPPTLRTP